MRPRHVLVVRPDSDGDVLLAGPAIRAVAAGVPAADGGSSGIGPTEVTLLCGPHGRQAADLLPAVARVVEWRLPWIDPEPPPVRAEDVDGLVRTLAALDLHEAIVLTSFHQSALPTALVLRLAGVPRVIAISEDYPGSLLDVRHRITGDPHEVARALSVVAAAGYRLPAGDDGRLRVTGAPDPRPLVGAGRYVVLHPGASVPARAWTPHRCAEAVDALHATGYRVVVTGSRGERSLATAVAGAHGLDLGGRTTFAELAGVLAGADAVVVGNTGPAHLAAAVGTPVVSLFAPVVPAARWAPYGVRTVLLGEQGAACRDSRARFCPVPGHPCLESVTAADVVAAVRRLVGEPPADEHADDRGARPTDSVEAGVASGVEA